MPGLGVRSNTYKCMAYIISGLMTGSPGDVLGETVCVGDNFHVALIHFSKEKGDWCRSKKWGVGNDGRYAVFQKRRDESQALRISEGLLALISYLEFGVFEDLRPVYVPDSMLKKGRILLSDVVRYNRRRFFLDEIEGEMGLGGGIVIHKGDRDRAFSYLPIVLKNSQIFDALVFYALSTKEFFFFGEHLREILSNPKRESKSRYEQLRMEHSFLNAYKAVEAIVGDPGRHADERFKKRLIKAGVDVAERVGFGSRIPIDEEMIRLQGIRDSRAGHGWKFTSIPLAYFDLINVQALAKYVISSALEKHGAKVFVRKGKYSLGELK